MFKNLLFAVLIMLGASAEAQDKMVYPRWRIGITPTSLLNTYPSIQVSLDRRLNERINLAVDGGYIFDFTSSAKGFLLRPNIELLLARGKWISYAFGVSMTYRETVGEKVRQVTLSRSRNGEFNFVNFLDVETMIVGMNLSNSVIMKVTKRLFIETSLSVGGGRKTIFVPGREIPGFENVGGSALTSSLPLLNGEVSISYALGL